jgi:hypothetical protein
VGEEEVLSWFKINELDPGAGKIAPLKRIGYFERRPHLSPAGFRIVIAKIRLPAR